MIDKLIVGILVVLILAAMLAGVLLVGAIAIYVYPSFPSLLTVLAALEIPYLGMLAILPLALFSDESEKAGMFFAIVAMAFLVWLLNSFILFLGRAWSIHPDGWVATVLGAPNYVLHQVLTFFDALYTALTGQPFEFRLPRPEAHAPIRRVARIDVGPVSAWVLDSIWAIVLGVISGIPVAMLWRGRR